MISRERAKRLAAIRTRSGAHSTCTRSCRQGSPAKGLDSFSTADEIAEQLVGLGELGIEEVRCDVYPRTTEAVEALQPIIDIVHAD